MTCGLEWLCVGSDCVLCATSKPHCLHGEGEIQAPADPTFWPGLEYYLGRGRVRVARGREGEGEGLFPFSLQWR